MKRRPSLFAAFGSVVAAAGFVFACSGGSFDPSSKLTSVRVLATRADKPFAKPGDTVQIDALTVDGRETPGAPMHVYWLPLVCNNPRADLYYACFASLLGGGLAAPDGGVPDAGPDGGALPKLPSSISEPIDITAFLQEGPSYSVALPPDLVSSHPVVDGAPAPYGLSISFFVACAGRVFLLPPDKTNVSGQTLPVGCGPDKDNLLGASDFVFAFTRVYAYDALTNENPVVDGVLLDGKPVDLTQGVVLPRCASDNEADCEHALEVHVPDASWELNPTDKGSDGSVRHEQLYASYFYTTRTTKTKSTGRIVFDPVRGRVDDSANRLIPGHDADSGRVWIVVHDNRDGVAWVSFPVFVK